ncbi:YciI family protein [Lysobacter cavernae]|uniref:YciI family protein n=1 Tax=Lysobacter cavernae TaxID=1685901 RepID=A0ABV7RNL9_9GAMM
MKYLCLFYDDESLFDAMPKGEFDSVLGEYFAVDDDLRRAGRMLGGEALQPARSATLLRVRDGRTSLTDGPYMETKEQLGGFMLIDAKDLDEAVAVMSRIPSARLGCIEVRPVLEFERP